MTILPRAATSPEITKLRSPNQSSRLYLTVQVPSQVYVARVASTPASTDNVASIPYNSGSGTYTNILADMTMYVSATGYGNYDKGMVRVRNTTGLGATSGSISVFTSEINWAANDYLTIVDAFDLWPRTPYGDNMDYDVAYVDQHSKCASMPVLGGRYKVKWLPAGGTVSAYPDASSSWPINNTITGVQWAAPGSSASSGMTTNTPTITYNAANFDAGYRTSLTLTNSDGVTSVGYGRVFVLAGEADAITQFRVDKIEGSYASSGWSAQITMYGQADLTVIRDRALCIIHRRDWYGLSASDEGSIGYVSDDENIEMVGWIAGDTIKWSPHWRGEGAVQFTIQGPQYWLNKLTMPAVGLKNISSHPPTNWKRFTGLTAKVATWHTLYWRTTAPACIDCFPIDNAWGALQLQGSGAQTVWNQLSTILNDFLIAKPCCDSLGRLHMQIEQNCLSAAQRSAIPTVMTLTTQDWMNAVDFERREVADVAAVDLSGDVYNGTTSTWTGSLSPGRTFGARGSSVFVRDRLVLFDQASANTLAGAVYGWKNNPYPKFKMQLASNMHMIDIAPYQYLATSIVNADTQRGFAATNLRLIPRTITRVFKDGVMLPEVEFEAESLIGLGIAGDAPATPPPPPTNPPPPPPPPPPPTPVPPSNADGVWQMHLKVGTGHVLTWAGDYDFTSSSNQPTWNAYTTWPASFDHPTLLGRFTMVSNKTFACISREAVGIWKLTNVAAMIATPATAPTWSSVIAVGDAVPGGTLASVRSIDAWGGIVLISATRNDNRALYGEYDGTTLTWTVTPSSGAVSITHQLYDIPTGVAIDHVATATLGGVVQHSFDWGFGAAIPTAMCRNYNNSTAYIGWYDGDGTHTMHIANAITGADLINTAVGTRFTTSVRTSLYGTGVFVTLDNNSSWVSLDGTTFTAGASFASDGQILDANRNGGGALVWTAANTANNEISRISLDHGLTYANKTGNFWSVVASVNLSFCGSQLTFA